jgi:hypothetical protein
MRLRPVILSTLALGVVAGGSALAAPRPVCNLVSDTEGDGKQRFFAQEATAPTSSPYLDIVNVDVATGKKEVVGVIKLKSAETTSDPTTMLPPGIKWSMSFKIGNTNHSFTLTRTTAAGSSRPTDTATASIGGTIVQGVVATVDSTAVTFKLPRTSVPALKRTKQVLSDIVATSHMWATVSDNAYGTGTEKYVDLTPSCLRPA